MTEKIDSNKSLGGTDNEGAINLLIDIKCTLIVVDYFFSVRNTPHSMSLVFCETNFRYHQYKKDAAT